MNDNFMRHFRWITPLLLAFCVYMLQDMFIDFKKLKSDQIEMKLDIVAIKTFLTKRIDH